MLPKFSSLPIGRAVSAEYQAREYRFIILMMIQAIMTLPIYLCFASIAMLKRR